MPVAVFTWKYIYLGIYLYEESDQENKMGKQSPPEK